MGLAGFCGVVAAVAVTVWFLGGRLVLVVMPGFGVMVVSAVTESMPMVVVGVAGVCFTATAGLVVLVRAAMQWVVTAVVRGSSVMVAMVGLVILGVVRPVGLGSWLVMVVMVGWVMPAAMPACSGVMAAIAAVVAAMAVVVACSSATAATAATALPATAVTAAMVACSGATAATAAKAGPAAIPMARAAKAAMPG